jgi:hypothetical protein
MVSHASLGSQTYHGFSSISWLAIMHWFLILCVARKLIVVSHPVIGSQSFNGFSLSVWLALLLWFLTPNLARIFYLVPQGYVGSQMFMVSHFSFGLISCA